MGRADRKIVPSDQVAGRDWPRPLVFTNGVFDVLHRGHIEYLAAARELGAALLVALNSDASARLLGKGPSRPLNSERDRLIVVPSGRVMVAVVELVKLIVTGAYTEQAFCFHVPVSVCPFVQRNQLPL